jgi:protein-S-isoprenylcysteine O-methyltransferase Ste14
MIQLILAYAFIGCYFLMEVLLRQKGSAKSLETGVADKGSTLAISASYAGSALLLVVLNFARVGLISAPLVSWLGLIVMLLGLAFRVRSMRVIGSSYSRTLCLSDSQEFVRKGPYRIIRHAGYLGNLLLWVGAATALANWIAVIAISPLIIGVYG